MFLEYSDNGSSWNKASNDFVLNNKISGDQKIETTETGLHKFWRLYILDNYRDGGTCSASSYFIAIGEMDIIFKE